MMLKKEKKRKEKKRKEKKNEREHLLQKKTGNFQ